eukprot:CAMPEP_0114300386 /NCGR_PEP_ID=MMETSP0059-20121206/13524_1 /TAXON_ID=36894 /ORGANISM="Pyramimonas parkeae, Strain CCMP726" /LENGTH=137 /DNA_ID=CAMNT_0001423011 /DNA_START=1286 /DNA_END=1696 /DNA_ORIENTATION=+
MMEYCEKQTNITIPGPKILGVHMYRGMDEHIQSLMSWTFVQTAGPDIANVPSPIDGMENTSDTCMRFLGHSVPHNTQFRRSNSFLDVGVYQFTAEVEDLIPPALGLKGHEDGSQPARGVALLALESGHPVCHLVRAT